MSDQTQMPVQSPLAEAEPQSLEELFSRDPRDLTDEDLEIIVKEFRRQRAAWTAAEAKGAKRAPRAAAAKAPPVTLADLGLE